MLSLISNLKAESQILWTQSQILCTILIHFNVVYIKRLYGRNPKLKSLNLMPAKQAMDNRTSLLITPKTRQNSPSFHAGLPLLPLATKLHHIFTVFAFTTVRCLTNLWKQKVRAYLTQLVVKWESLIYYVQFGSFSFSKKSALFSMQC